MSQYVDPYETLQALPPAYTGYGPPPPVTVMPVTNVQVEVHKKEPEVIVVQKRDNGADLSVGCCLGCLCSACFLCTVM